MKTLILIASLTCQPETLVTPFIDVSVTSNGVPGATNDTPINNLQHKHAPKLYSHANRLPERVELTKGAEL